MDFEIDHVPDSAHLTAYLAAVFVGAVSAGILAAVGLEVLGLGPQNVPPSAHALLPFNRSALFRGCGGGGAHPF